MMAKAKIFSCLCLILGGLFWGTISSAQNTDSSNLEINLQITAEFSPMDLLELKEKLEKRGLQLDLTETAYCNGRLSVLRGIIKGSDGSEASFSSLSLKRLTITLRGEEDKISIKKIQIKNRWFKCREQEDNLREEQWPDKPVLLI